MNKSFQALSLVAAASILVGCATSPKKFYEDPQSVKNTPLCRAYFESTDASFRADVADELNKRGLSQEDCMRKIQEENAAIAIAAVAVGTAAVVAACSGGGCAGGTAQSYTTDYDCYGGTGNGPLYVYSPVHVGINDPYDLDRDGDGIGCEASDIGLGS